jgi:glycosyltransferase involved in cell wall biosynthesis
MKTSVIVTTYKRPNALKRVLEGLRHQTVLPNEVIVADDGSGPDTGEMIDRQRIGSPYLLHHIWQEDRGFRAARIRNKAILRSRGDYLISLDGDCVPGKHFIADHLKLAEKGCFFQGKRILVGKSLAPLFTHKDANSVGKLLKYAFTNRIRNSHHIIRMTRFPSIVSTSLKGIKSCNMGFFRNDIFAINGFNEDFVGWGREDSELAVRLFVFGLKRKGHPFMAICHHLWHEQDNRDRLSINDELLRMTVQANGYICSNGLVKR